MTSQDYNNNNNENHLLWSYYLPDIAVSTFHGLFYLHGLPHKIWNRRGFLMKSKPGKVTDSLLVQ